MSWSRSILPGPPTSPVGDVMQTPQFQLRRLKKQLAVERDNRDELELELAENRKLITEKGRWLAGGPGVQGGSLGLRSVLGLAVTALTPSQSVLRHGVSCWTPGKSSLSLWGFSAVPSRAGTSGLAVPPRGRGCAEDPCC